MPSQQHPRAQFVPLSPNIDLDALVNDNQSFDHVRRVPQSDLEAHSVQSLEQLVYMYVVQEGRPLVLEGWGSYIPPWLFSSKWLEDNLGREGEWFYSLFNHTISDVNFTFSTKGSRHHQWH